MTSLSGEDVTNDFNKKYDKILTDILYDLKVEYKEKGIPILNKDTDTQYTDFLKFILHNINLQDIYS